MNQLHITKYNCNSWRNKTNSTTPPPSGYTSWLDYWEDNANTTPMFCCVKGCTTPAQVGAHIYQKHYCSDVYIAPYCSMHNNYYNDEYNTLEIDTLLVPVPNML